MKKFILIGLTLLSCHIAEAKNITLYCRSDTHTTNTVTGYILAIVNSNSVSAFGSVDGIINISPNGTPSGNTKATVSILHSDGSETVLGTDIAVVDGAQSGSGIVYNAIWNCPETPMVPTDAIKIVWKTYAKILQGGASDTDSRIFVSSQLGWTKLNASIWTLYRYVTATYSCHATGGDPTRWVSVCSIGISHGDSVATTYINGIDYTRADGGYSMIY